MKTVSSRALTALALMVVAQYPMATQAAEASCRLTWEKDGGPRRVGWQLADLSIQTRDLDEEARASGVLTLPAGTACLVALNNGALPVVLAAPALEAGAALSSRSWLPATTIRGVAVDDTGAPVRAEVHLQTANEDPDGPTCGDVLDRMGVTVAQALPNGEFLVGPVAAGRYRMTATAPDHSDFVTELSIVGGDTTATFDRGEIALPRVAQLLISCSLESVSTKDGLPIPDARVVLEQSLTDDEGAAPTGMTSVSTTTGQDGRFVFESAKPADRSTLKVTAEGYLHHSEDIWIDDDGAQELWIEIEESDKLSGTVCRFRRPAS
jgi:hypothetical protein